MGQTTHDWEALEVIIGNIAQLVLTTSASLGITFSLETSQTAEQSMGEVDAALCLVVKYAPTIAMKSQHAFRMNAA
jgi:hypothetical protein